jgi:arginine-tRNA-protein transferase
LSALREVTLAKEIHEAGVPDLKYVYLGIQFISFHCSALWLIFHEGFYVYSSQKMRYKGDYSPSYLTDPVRDIFPIELHVACLLTPA